MKEFIRGLLERWGLRREEEVVVQFNREQMEALRKMAILEERPAQEIADELVIHALARRLTAQDTLRMWHTLTNREQQVVALVCQGYANWEVGERLSITVGTVQSHLKNVYEKLEGVRTKYELRALFMDWDFGGWEP